MTLQEVLEAVAKGSLSLEEAAGYLDSYGFVEAGMQKLDLHREKRTSMPEVVFGLGKSASQLAELFLAAVERDVPLLATKVGADKVAAVREVAGVEYDEVAQVLRRGVARSRVAGRVAVISAGASDVAIAEEAAATLEYFGVDRFRAYDCGVAGLHRLFAHGEEISSADVVIVVAGMEGALPSVIAGLFRQPIIAVPTSVGYGSSFEGLSALLTMMNSCAPGITVVNIDNGFGAAVAARSMLLMAARRAASLNEKEDS